MIQLLILGGLDTTAGALGQFMLRFIAEPEIPDLLRRSTRRSSRSGRGAAPARGPVHRDRPNGHQRHRDRRAGDRGGRQGPDLLGVGQPRRGRVLLSARLRPRTGAEPPPGVRGGPASVRRLEPGPHQPAAGGRAGRPAPPRREAGGWRRADRVPLRAEPGAARGAHHVRGRTPTRNADPVAERTLIPRARTGRRSGQVRGPAITSSCTAMKEVAPKRSSGTCPISFSRNHSTRRRSPSRSSKYTSFTAS